MLDAVERLRDQSVEGIIVIAPQTTAVNALSNTPSDVPLVAVGCGTGRTSRSPRSRWTTRPAPNAPRPTCSTSGTRPCTTSPVRPRGSTRRSVRRLAARAQVAGARRCPTAHRRGLVPRPASNSAGGSPGARRHRGVLRQRHMALGLMRALQQAGRRVPRTSASSGSTTSRRPGTSPPLTTVRQDFSELGRRALRAARRADRRRPARPAGRAAAHFHRARLVVRASAARPAG